MNFFKRILPLFLVFTLLVTQYAIFVPAVFAASSPWSQTDWSGGSGQTTWSDTTKFDSSANIYSSTPGQLTLLGWSSRKKITFDNSAQAENLTNFPVLIKLDSTRIDYAQTQNAGQDIRFTDSDGTTQLSYEIEKWDESGTSIVWVKVPQVDASSATDYIYMYYGNTGAADAQNKTAVWSNSFIGVWHLAETGNGTAGEYKDSSSTGADGQGGGGTSAATPTVDTAGAIGNSAVFDGTDDFINAGSSSVFKITNTPFTFTAWVNPTNLSRIMVAFGNDNLSSGWNIRVNTSGTFGYVTRGATLSFDSTATITAGAWSHISGTYSGDPTKFRDLFKNGTFSNSQTYTGSIASAACNFLLGARWASGCGAASATFIGKLDEVRISNVVRSASWLAASYKSETDIFNTFGSTEPINEMFSTPTTGTLTSSIFDTEGGSNWGLLTYTVTTPANTTASVKVRSSNSSTMAGTTDFASCTAIVSGSDISSNSCVTDGHRYIQYQVTLASTDGTSTPTFQDISIAFSPFDTDGPAFELDSPANNSYTNNTRPTFRWKKATDTTSSVSDYDFSIDNPSIGANEPSGDFGISDIPIYQNTDYETSKFIVQYENFEDADPNNDMISLHTKSSADWTASENFGELREGVVAWHVRATDALGNTTEHSRTLFVDRTRPNATFTQINATPLSASTFSTPDTTPTIFGKITDPLAGGDTTLAQTKYGPRVASGPKQADITIEKKEGTSYTLHTLYTINFDSSQFTCDGKEITDTADQSCDKYAPFEYKSEVPLDPGTYKVTLTGRDTVDNVSDQTSIFLTISASNQTTVSTQPPEEIPQTVTTPTPSESVENPIEPVSTAPNLFDTLFHFLTAVIDWLEQTALIAYANILHMFNQTLASIENGYLQLTDTAPGIIKFVLNGLGNGFTTCRDISALFIRTIQLAFTAIDMWATNLALRILPLVEVAQANIQNTFRSIASSYHDLSNKESLMKQELSFFVSTFEASIGASIGNGFVTLAAHSTGIPKAVLTGIANGLTFASTAIADTTNAISSSFAAISDTTLRAIASATDTINAANKHLTNQISGVAFLIGEKTQDISDTAGYAIINFTYNFVTEPTTIHDVSAVALSPTSAKVTWTTNHPANGKVNWGLQEGIYTFEDQTNKRTTHHEFILTNLTPGTEYNYEVMSHNKNYVYDANRKFTTPTE